MHAQSSASIERPSRSSEETQISCQEDVTCAIQERDRRNGEELQWSRNTQRAQNRPSADVAWCNCAHFVPEDSQRRGNQSRLLMRGYIYIYKHIYKEWEIEIYVNIKFSLNLYLILFVDYIFIYILLTIAHRWCNIMNSIDLHS